jgi:hypothetical protein
MAALTLKDLTGEERQTIADAAAILAEHADPRTAEASRPRRFARIWRSPVH